MALTESDSGFLGGAAMGMQVGGPVGFLVGGALGAVFGSKAGKKRRDAEYKALVANTKQSYRIGKDTLSGIKKSREDVATQYERGISSQRARFAASGGRAEGASYQRTLGSVAKERDTSLGEIDTQEETFRKGEAYKFIKQDFDYMTKANRFSNGPGYNEEGFNYSVRTEGRAGTGFYNDDQKKMLKTIDDDKVKGGGGIFAQYMNEINPTFQQYEQFAFGDETDKTKFESDMTQRITQANTRYDERVLESQLSEARRVKGQFL